jgi:hypothetical protein
MNEDCSFDDEFDARMLHIASRRQQLAESLKNLF